MGYHLTEIQKGKLGDSSKILEELQELMDAESQDCKLMVLLELSDIIGAIELYLQKNYPDISLRDLIIMNKITQRAFLDGSRK